MRTYESKYAYPKHDEMVVNLLEHYEQCDHDDLATGVRWYSDTRRYARLLATEHGGGVGRAAGIIAALSPQIQWERNKLLAAEVMCDGRVTGQSRANVLKSLRIYDGERPLSVLGGPKVRAFYRAIMGDEDAAVLDGWMSRALGRPVAFFSARQYERCAAALREAASYTSLTTAQFQAVVWTHVRGGGE